MEQVQRILIDNRTDGAAAALTGHLAIAIYAYARQRVGSDLARTRRRHRQRPHPTALDIDRVVT